MAEALRELGLCTTGGNWKTLKIWVERWGISTEHFDPDIARHRNLGQAPKPIDELLVESSTASRQNVKLRLYQEGLKQRRCELCGQDEVWRGGRLALILDHINGVRNDNRIENLRMVCPNCAATFDTHCGRKNAMPASPQPCARCETPFMASFSSQKYCSRYCGQRAPRSNRGVPNIAIRRAERPPHEQLLEEIATLGYSAVGRRYGVSDNAIRKWVRWYERELEGGDPA